MTALRILHLDTEPTWRGGERQVFWLAGELKRRGHAVWVACRPEAPLAQRCQTAGLPIAEMAPKGEWDIWAAKDLRTFLRDNRVDILHAHTAHAVGLGALASIPKICPFIATRRVDFPLRRNPLSVWKYGRLDEIVAISEKVRDVMLDNGWHGPKISVIHSGIDPSDYPQPSRRAQIRQAKGIRLEDVVLVNAAALVPHKDQDTLIRAVARLRQTKPDVRLLILGEGKLRNQLTKLIGELNLQSAVQLMGHRDDVLDYIALSDVFVLSSVEEGLGTSLLDAMALGIPAVATKAGGIPEIFGPTANDVLVPSKNPDALALALLKILDDPAERAKRSNWGRERLAFFSVNRMVDQYEGLYARVLQGFHDKTQRHSHHA